ncbi:MAG: hypothetical protein LHW44_07630 [Candidatus Cloacimonetes bacterium]|nr:hypothetical protein [Candidatus Cloacimonadota bacterium]
MNGSVISFCEFLLSGLISIVFIVSHLAMTTLEYYTQIILRTNDSGIANNTETA